MPGGAALLGRDRSVFGGWPQQATGSTSKQTSRFIRLPFLARLPLALWPAESQSICPWGNKCSITKAAHSLLSTYPLYLVPSTNVDPASEHEVGIEATEAAELRPCGHEDVPDSLESHSSLEGEDSRDEHAETSL